MTSELEVVVIIVAILAIAEAVAIVVLASEVGRLSLLIAPARSALPLAPNEGLDAGVAIPTARLIDARTGEAVRLDGPHLLMFLAGDCGPCQQLWPAATRLAREVRGDVGVVGIVSGDPTPFHGSDGPTVCYDADGSVGDAYQVKRTPFCYVIGDGVVRAKGVANTYSQLVSLLAGHRVQQSVGRAP